MLPPTYPERIPVARYLPPRRAFSFEGFDPARAWSPGDLPPWLVLGALEDGSFTRDGDGWFARWRGLDQGTWFDVAWQGSRDRYVIGQSWCGSAGPSVECDARERLDRVIGTRLYDGFPVEWEATLARLLQARYQVSCVPQVRGRFSAFGIPDGPLRDIVFPVSVARLDGVATGLRRALAEWQLPYPVTAEVRMLSNAVNYVEGKAPEWTQDPDELLLTSVNSTGTFPLLVPVREESTNGPAAWTLRRQSYFAFVTVPLAGIIDLMLRLCQSDASVRTRSEAPIAFELQPMVVPSLFERQVDEFEVLQPGVGGIRKVIRLVRSDDDADDLPGAGGAGDAADASLDGPDLEGRSARLVAQAKQCTEYWKQLARGRARGRPKAQ